MTADEIVQRIAESDPEGIVEVGDYDGTRITGCRYCEEPLYYVDDHAADCLWAASRRLRGLPVPTRAKPNPERFLCRCGFYSDEHAETSDHKPERPSGSWYVNMDPNKRTP